MLCVLTCEKLNIRKDKKDKSGRISIRTRKRTISFTVLQIEQNEVTIAV